MRNIPFAMDQRIARAERLVARSKHAREGARAVWSYTFSSRAPFKRSSGREIGTGEEDYTAARGQMCGGFAGTRCGAGLRCNYNRGLNTGTCVDDPNAASRGASEGETCGGTANIQCKSGLTCKKRSGATKGTCVTATANCQALPECDDGHRKVASAGEMCGGFAGTTCKAGLRCDNSLGLNTGRCR